MRAHNSTITGQWLSEARIMLTGARRATLLLQSFANTKFSPEDPASLVTFIGAWGPLMTPFLGGESFEESVIECFHAQREFQADWRRLGYAAARKHWPAPASVATAYQRLSGREGQRVITGEWIRVRRREAWAGLFGSESLPRFVFDFEASPFQVFGSVPGAKGALRVGLRSLLDFITLSLYATDARYLRKCWRRDCAAYFVAEDQKAHFCSHGCSQWGRSETKRQWHIKHGKEWREKRQGKEC